MQITEKKYLLIVRLNVISTMAILSHAPTKQSKNFLIDLLE